MASKKNGKVGNGDVVKSLLALGFISTARVLVESKIFTTFPEELGVSARALLFKVVDAIEKSADARRKVIRESLLEYAKSHGEEDPDKGHFRAEVEGFKLTAEKRRSSEPDAEGLKELLNKKSIKLSEAFDEVKTLVVNPTKVAFLVETGKIKAKDVEALHNFSFALRVTEAVKELKEELAVLKPASLEE